MSRKALLAPFPGCRRNGLPTSVSYVHFHAKILSTGLKNICVVDYMLSIGCNCTTLLEDLLEEPASIILGIRVVWDSLLKVSFYIVVYTSYAIES